MRLRAFTGALSLGAGEALALRFSLLLTPVKPLSTRSLFGPRMRRAQLARTRPSHLPSHDASFRRR